MAENVLTKAQEKELRKKERAEFESKLKKDQNKGNMKRIGMWVVAAAVIVLSLWGLIALVSAPTPTNQELALTAPKITNTDLSFGPENAKVTIIEYADFQCPSCKNQQPNVDQLKSDYAGKIRYVYRFFPIQQIHPNANLSAAAGYAAYKQGKFGEMADLLFTNQEKWALLPADQAQQMYMDMAKSLSLDTDKFKQDMESQTTKDFIQKEMDEGTAAGVNATPTFFINGKQFQIPTGYAEYKQLVDTALSAK